jgi:hypothetical protein
MHCQQVKGFWLAVVLLLVNFFSFLPHRLQQQRPMFSCFFFMRKSIVLFAAATISILLGKSENFDK